MTVGHLWITLLIKLHFCFIGIFSSFNLSLPNILGDPGAVSGAGEKSKQARKKFGQRKVKKVKKSPWGQGFNEPVPNGRGSSGF